MRRELVDLLRRLQDWIEYVTLCAYYPLSLNVDIARVRCLSLRAGRLQSMATSFECA